MMTDPLRYKWLKKRLNYLTKTTNSSLLQATNAFTFDIGNILEKEQPVLKSNKQQTKTQKSVKSKLKSQLKPHLLGELEAVQVTLKIIPFSIIPSSYGSLQYYLFISPIL